MRMSQKALQFSTRPIMGINEWPVRRNARRPPSSASSVLIIPLGRIKPLNCFLFYKVVFTLLIATALLSNQVRDF